MVADAGGMAVSDVEGVEVVMATLYLTEQQSLIKHEGEALRVQIPAARDGSTQARVVRVPLIKIDQVVVVGDITLTSSAMRALLEQRKAIHFLTWHGRSLGSLVPDPSKNALLHLAQARAVDSLELRAPAARAFVGGKIQNMRTVLLRYHRSRPSPTIEAATEQLRMMLHQVRNWQPAAVVVGDRMNGLGTLLGLEGNASAAYFGVFGALLHTPLGFAGRIKRPPTDPVNALLSFGYTVLTNQITSLICVVGLNPMLGLLHQPGYGKPALALDLVEEFRPLIVDSVVIGMINTGQLGPADFVDELGAIRLQDAARKLFLGKLEERLSEQVQHPLFKYRVTYRRCIELQARLLAKWLLGEVPHYIPFVVR